MAVCVGIGVTKCNCSGPTASLPAEGARIQCRGWQKQRGPKRLQSKLTSKYKAAEGQGFALSERVIGTAKSVNLTKIVSSKRQGRP